jgi:hypothetical protein
MVHWVRSDTQQLASERKLTAASDQAFIASITARHFLLHPRSVGKHELEKPHKR